ncbi:MAG: hypothetical protein QG584_1933, partial [Pseudomonadota bacterium]|nr:hypothetical protein [Pseudomonadota bacterium]
SVNTIYTGVLNWIDEPQFRLDLTFLRIFDDRVMFKATSFSNIGIWTVEGSALNDGNGYYTSSKLTAIEQGTTSDPLQIVFDTVKINRDGNEGFVTGEWIDKFGRHQFSGDIYKE